MVESQPPEITESFLGWSRRQLRGELVLMVEMLTRALLHTLIVPSQPAVMML